MRDAQAWFLTLALLCALCCVVVGHLAFMWRVWFVMTAIEGRVMCSSLLSAEVSAVNFIEIESWITL